MKRPSISVALQIAQLLNENEPKVISDAVGLLRRHGSDHDLLAFLVETGARTSGKLVKKRVNARSNAAERSDLKERLSELNERRPDIYRAVLQFEESLIEGRLLSRSEEIKRLGQMVSKKFKPGKSRGEAINSLILELLRLNDGEIVAVIEHVESDQTQPESDGFQQLAHYLIGFRSS